MQVALTEGAAVANDGLWVLSIARADILSAAPSGGVERFVNRGTLRTAAGRRSATTSRPG